MGRSTCVAAMVGGGAHAGLTGSRREATALPYWHTTVHWMVFAQRVPVLPGFLVAALFIRLAQTIGSWPRPHPYRAQAPGWRPASIGKLGSRYPLMTISFVLATTIHPPKVGTRGPRAAATRAAAPTDRRSG